MGTLSVKISTKNGLTMSLTEWIEYLDTLSLDEIKTLFWDEFSSEARKTLNPYLKKRISNIKYPK